MSKIKKSPPRRRKSEGRLVSGQDREARSKNFWRNLQACLARLGLDEQALIDAGIERPVVNRWRREGLAYLWGETSSILERVLRIENANDLFGIEVPAAADTSGKRTVPVSPDVDKEMHDRLGILLASPFRDATCLILTSMHHYFLRR